MTQTSRKYSRQILAALKSGDGDRIREVMHNIADDADDFVSDAIGFYENGNGMFASLCIAKAHGALKELGEMIQKAMEDEHDTEID